MRFKLWMKKVLAVIARGLVRWLEILGENPTLVRDHGISAWQHLQRQAAERPEAAHPDGAGPPPLPAPQREIAPARPLHLTDRSSRPLRRPSA